MKTNWHHCRINYLVEGIVFPVTLKALIRTIMRQNDRGNFMWQISALIFHLYIKAKIKLDHLKQVEKLPNKCPWPKYNGWFKTIIKKS